MAPTAKMLREDRQINVAVGAAPQADALAAQVEQRDNGTRLTLVEMRGDFAAVAEAACRPHRGPVVELAIDHRRLRQFRVVPEFGLDRRARVTAGRRPAGAAEQAQPRAQSRVGHRPCGDEPQAAQAAGDQVRATVP